MISPSTLRLKNLLRYVEEMRPAGNGMPKLKGFQIMSLTVMWSNIFHFHPFIFHARHRPHRGRGWEAFDRGKLSDSPSKWPGRHPIITQQKIAFLKQALKWRYCCNGSDIFDIYELYSKERIEWWRGGWLRGRRGSLCVRGLHKAVSNHTTYHHQRENEKSIWIVDIELYEPDKAIFQIFLLLAVSISLLCYSYFSLE